MGLLRSSGRARRRRQHFRQAQMNGEGDGGGDVTSNGGPTGDDDDVGGLLGGGGGATPNTIKLIRKLVIYGVVFAFMRWGKGRNAPDKDTSSGGEGGEWAAPSIARTFLSGEDGIEVRVLDDFLPPDVAKRWRRDMMREWSRVRNGRWRYATQVESSSRKSTSDDTIVERNDTVHRALDAGTGSYSGWELPPGDDSHLAGEMSDAFAGNHHGRSALGLPERVRLAVSDNGGPEGAGRDDPPAAVSSEDEFAEFSSDLRGDDVLGRPALVLSSFAATHYATGDFRTLMDDSSDVDDDPSSSPSPSSSSSPAVFFFISLTQEGWNDGLLGDGEDEGGVKPGGKNEAWPDQYGGEMRFECGDGGPPRSPPHRGDGGDPQASSPPPAGSKDMLFCENVRPKFNRAVLFRVPPSRKIPRHEVRPVSWLAEEGGFRHLVLWGTYREGPKNRGDGTAATDATPPPRPRREGTEESTVGTDGEL